MKTKFYLTLGLFTSFIASSFAQEIVSEFSPTDASVYSNVVEASDGTLLVGSCPNPYSHLYTVYKATTDGIFLDSTVFQSEYQLLDIPSVADTFLLVGFSHNYSDNIYNLKLTLIDSELNAIREALFPIGERTYDLWDYNVFITPNQEIVFPYSVNISDVLHIMRIGLDLTMIEDKAYPNIPRGTWNHENTSDSIVFYTKIDVFSNLPLTYHCLGFYKGTHDTTVFVNHILDSDFNYLGNNHISTFDESTVFTNEPLTTINEIEDESNSKYYLMATCLGFPNDTSAAIVKYNDKNDAVDMYKFSGNYYSYCIGQMVVKDYNSIYFTHSCIDFNKPTRLAKLNGDLNLEWELPIESRPGTVSILNELKVLNNGNILVGAIIYNYDNYPRLWIYIIDESLNRLPETTADSKPFDLYPNPVKDALNIRFDGIKTAASVTLYDLTGRHVATKQNALESIDLSMLPSGIYMVCVTYEDGEKRFEKVVKQ